jgi:lauroyl/myristoyl acyltransferase
MLQFIGFKIIIFLIKILPRKTLYFIGRQLINILLLFKKKDIAVVKKNFFIIKNCPLTQEQSKQYIKKNFYNFTYYLIDFLASPALNKQNVDDFIKIKGKENLKEAIKHDKGGIIISAHIGNWELGAHWIALKGYKLNAVALPHKNKKVNDIFSNNRSNKGIQTIDLGKASRQCLKVLKENEFLALICDRVFDPAEKTIKVDFFNKKIKIPRGPAYLSMKTGAVIVPCFCIRHGIGKYTLIIEKPIYPTNNEVDIAKSYMKLVEKYINLYPEQWFAFQNVWK